MFVAAAAAGSFAALLAAVSLVFCVLMIVRNTRRIGTLRARERELNRPRMTPEDYRRLREMEIELGWEPSEVPASALAPSFTPPPALTLPVTGMTTMAGFEAGVARLSGTSSRAAKGRRAACDCGERVRLRARRYKNFG
jgi:hypothetical protein